MGTTPGLSPTAHLPHQMDTFRIGAWRPGELSFFVVGVCVQANPGHPVIVAIGVQQMHRGIIESGRNDQVILQNDNRSILLRMIGTLHHMSLEP